LCVYVDSGDVSMSQITLYLDDETDALLSAAAATSGLSKSRWVAEVIRRYAADAWPADCRNLAGAFPDFPLRESEASEAQPPDLPRLGF
jgi:hypothetical protein